MAKGVILSQNGHGIDEKNVSSSVISKDQETLSYMISSIAFPYLYGAEVTLVRYVAAAAQIDEGVNYIQTCIHEASSLMEHLDSVDRYLIMCGVTHETHKKIKNIRNHIRHDLRDNLTKEHNNVRIKRAKELGIKDGLLVDLSFDKNHIRVGTTVLTVDEIKDFIIVSNKKFVDLMRGAIDKGRIKGAKNE